MRCDFFLFVKRYDTNNHLSMLYFADYQNVFPYMHTDTLYTHFTLPKKFKIKSFCFHFTLFTDNFSFSISIYLYILNIFLYIH